MIARMVEIGRGDPRGGKCVEKDVKSRATEKENVGKSNQKKKNL
jgi:hypothetical protein